MRQMHCPTCKKVAGAGPANRYRPFCSERCQMVDLGQWARGDYSVAGSPIEDKEHPDDRGGKLKPRDRNPHE